MRFETDTSTNSSSFKPMPFFSCITRTKGVCGGEPVVSGTRMSVAFVKEAFKVLLKKWPSDLAMEKFLESYPWLNKFEVEAALQYK